MKDQTKKNLKTAAAVTGVALGTAFLVMRHIAKKQYPDSVYANQPEEQNPMQGRNLTASENKDSNLHNLRGKEHLFRYRDYTPFTVLKTDFEISCFENSYG